MSETSYYRVRGIEDGPGKESKHFQQQNSRLLVKNSFIVELSEAQRKLRHLFLFNDVLVCAKYKLASGKNEKFTFQLKWYIPLSQVRIDLFTNIL
jgi:breakpoint cluster region protein